MAKKNTAQYKYPFITLQQAVMTQQLEARGGEREGNRGATGLQTLQPPLRGGHQGAAALSTQPSSSSNWELNKPQRTGGHGTCVAVDKQYPLP